MMKGYGENKIGGCWKRQNISLGDTEAFNRRNCSKGHDGLFQKVPWTLAAATIPLAEGQMRRGIISDTLFRGRKHSCEGLAAVSEETAGTKSSIFTKLSRSTSVLLLAKL